MRPPPEGDVLLNPNGPLHQAGIGQPAQIGALSADLFKRAQKRLLEMHFHAGVGHIGGNLSALDALLVLHHEVMGPDDVFVLAKGHAAGALYVTLWSLGRLSDDDLNTFHRDGTFLAGHPVAGWSRDIPFATGSLGHGLPDAAGMALGYKLQSQSKEVFCLTSDGEWQEGSNWEALIFAVHQKLTNLTILIDANGLQGFGTTDAVASMDPLENKFKGFAIEVVSIDGHDHGAIRSALHLRGQGPRIIVLRTVKGHGVSFMENAMEWHYLPLNAEQYRIALREIDDRHEKTLR
jgi:transketolase